MISLQTYVRRGQFALRRWALNPKLHTLARCLAYVLSGFVLSAASLGNVALPLALGLVCACTGWSALLCAAGSALGYWVFWGSLSVQPVVWLVFGTLVALLLTERRFTQHAPFLVPAVACLVVAASGVVFQVHFQDNTPILLYLLRVVLAGGSTWLLTRVLRQRDPILEWLTCGIGILSLAQIVPIPYLGFGYIGAAAITVAGAFPAAALAGLALDLAQITPVPMTAVLALSFLVRLLPRCPKQLLRLSPVLAFLLVMGLGGYRDLQPLPALLLGGLAGAYLPGPGKATHRRGETGVAQVRLEVAAQVLAQTEQLLLEAPEIPVDEAALVAKAAERACGNCPCRKNCKDSKRIGLLPGPILHKPLLTTEELPLICRKSGRFLAELHRSQEQLRSIRADRERQKEYRSAVIQQYQFLSDFLRDLSDQLARRTDSITPSYVPQVSVYANRPEGDNGDRCLQFPGVMCKYYVLLCDGMGTGLGAVQEGRSAGVLLRRLLSAGYPAEHALRSLNSLCALRGRAGAVTVDLLEIQLNNGHAVIYKWGAPASFVVTSMSADKLGCAGPPPGLSVTDCQETSHRLTLRGEETVYLVSDGIGEEEALHCCLTGIGLSAGELSSRILTCAQIAGQDDATVVSIRLEHIAD